MTNELQQFSWREPQAFLLSRCSYSLLHMLGYSYSISCIYFHLIKAKKNHYKDNFTMLNSQLIILNQYKFN